MVIIIGIEFRTAVTQDRLSDGRISIGITGFVTALQQDSQGYSTNHCEWFHNSRFKWINLINGSKTQQCNQSDILKTDLLDQTLQQEISRYSNQSSRIEYVHSTSVDNHFLQTQFRISFISTNKPCANVCKIRSFDFGGQDRWPLPNFRNFIHKWKWTNTTRMPTGSAC